MFTTLRAIARKSRCFSGAVLLVMLAVPVVSAASGRAYPNEGAPVASATRPTPCPPDARRLQTANPRCPVQDQSSSSPDRIHPRRPGSRAFGLQFDSTD